MAYGMRLREPTRKANEQSYVVGGCLLQFSSRLLAGDVSANELEANSQFLCPPRSLLGETSSGVQVCSDDLNVLHQTWRARSNRLEWAEKVVGEPTGRRKDP